MIPEIQDALLPMQQARLNDTAMGCRVPGMDEVVKLREEVLVRGSEGGEDTV